MTTPSTAAQDAAGVVHDQQGHGFTLREIACPTCGPSDVDVLGWRGGRYHRFGLGVETRIVRCRSCSLLFPNPFPVPVDSEALYGGPGIYFAGQDSAVKVQGYRELIREITQRVGGTSYRLLDVGCGCGELLQAANLEGVRGAIGLDFSPQMVAAAQERYGVDARAQLIEDFAASDDEAFDVVMLCGILEHVTDPDAFVASVAKVAKPGAWIYLDIPQEPHLLSMIGNSVNRLLGSKAVYNLSPTWLPFHVFGFNIASLRALLGKHGIEIVSHRAWAAPDLLGGMGICQRLRAFVGSQINRIANLTGTAHNMYVWARCADNT